MHQLIYVPLAALRQRLALQRAAPKVLKLSVLEHVSSVITATTSPLSDPGKFGGILIIFVYLGFLSSRIDIKT